MALQIPFANTGDRKPIPQGQSADGSVSWEKGFTSLYALAPQDGGKFIDRQEFNQIVYEISEATIENSQATAELIDDEATSTAKTWSSSKISADIQAIETEITQQGSKLLTKNETKTVGASGADFATLKAALEWCLQYSPNQKYTITLKCNADMPIPGSLASLKGSLGFVTIDGQSINRTLSLNGPFLYISWLDILEIKNFTINNTNNSGPAEILYIEYSKAKIFNTSITTNSNSINLFIRNGAHVTADSLTLINNSTTGGRCAYLNVDAFAIFISSRFVSKYYTAIQVQGSRVRIESNCDFTENAAQIDLSSIIGSICYAGSNVTKTNIAKNTATDSGIIFG